MKEEISFHQSAFEKLNGENQSAQSLIMRPLQTKSLCIILQNDGF